MKEWLEMRLTQGRLELFCVGLTCPSHYHPTMFFSILGPEFKVLKETWEEASIAQWKNQLGLPTVKDLIVKADLDNYDEGLDLIVECKSVECTSKSAFMIASLGHLRQQDFIVECENCAAVTCLKCQPSLKLADNMEDHLNAVLDIGKHKHIQDFR